MIHRQEEVMHLSKAEPVDVIYCNINRLKSFHIDFENFKRHLPCLSNKWSGFSALWNTPAQSVLLKKMILCKKRI